MFGSESGMFRASLTRCVSCRLRGCVYTEETGTTCCGCDPAPGSGCYYRPPGLGCRRRCSREELCPAPAAPSSASSSWSSSAAACGGAPRVNAAAPSDTRRTSRRCSRCRCPQTGTGFWRTDLLSAASALHPQNTAVKKSSEREPQRSPVRSESPQDSIRSLSETQSELLPSISTHARNSSWGKLLLEVVHDYNIAVRPKNVTNYVTFYGK